jgi:prevent-host-death family protein
MKKVAASELRSHLARYLEQAAREDVVITMHDKPVGVLIGFGSDDDWLDYALENSPAFLARVKKARMDLRAGRGTRLEKLGP